MANPTKYVQFCEPENGKIFRSPAPWQGTEPTWLRDHGRTIVAVVDDQLQRDAQLSTKRRLQTDIIDPLNVEFLYFEECSEGHPAARDRKWFEHVATRLSGVKDRLALVLLDMMFTGDSDALSGAGLEFLKLVYEQGTIADIPIVIITQAREEHRLRQAIAAAGMSCEFLRKEPDKWPDSLTWALCKFGRLSDPQFGAYSSLMRKEMVGLRQYAMNRPTLSGAAGQQLPLPILFTAPSGEGKTWTAKRAADWFLNWEPAVRPNAHCEELDCNTLDRAQSTRIRLFGRGPITPQINDPNAAGQLEVPDASGLVERGVAQRAAGGVLLVDELGNSGPDVQNYLITFVEKGTTEPEFASTQMTADALGPLDVLCIFTAQPAHIAEGKISIDMERRFKRGVHVDIAPLHERPQDIVPLFYDTLASYRRQDDPAWKADVLDNVILPDAQALLVEAAVHEQLSSSLVADLVGQPGAKVVIGRPYLEYRLSDILRHRQRRSNPSVSQRQPVDSVAKVLFTPPEPNMTNVRLILQAMAALRLDSFPHHSTPLGELREDVYGAVINLLLRFLEAAVYANLKGPKKEVDVQNTARTLFEGHAVNNTTKAASHLTYLMPVELDENAVIIALRESTLLAQLAIKICKGRSKPIEDALRKLASDPVQAQRLEQFGWVSPDDGKVKT